MLPCHGHSVVRPGPGFIWSFFIFVIHMIWNNDESIKCSLQNTAQHKQLLGVRRALPVFNHREQVLDRVHKDSMVIVAGETGSGKSTQVPQFLLEVRQGH